MPKRQEPQLDTQAATDVAEDTSAVEARLRAKIAAEYEQQLRKAEASAELYKELAAQAQLQVQEAKGNDESSALEIELLYDPYDVHNPLAILKDLPPTEEYPHGQTLGWKSPSYRARRGWRGWVPIQYGDEYAGANGEGLLGYLPDPPARLAGEQKLDSYVRRMNLILCRLDTRLQEARTQKQIAKAHASRESKSTEQLIAEGIAITGPGMTATARGLTASRAVLPPGKNVLKRTVFPVS